MHFKLQPLVWDTYECSYYFKEDWLVKPQIKSQLKAVPVSPEIRFHLYFTVQLSPNTVWATSMENKKHLESEKHHSAAWYTMQEEKEENTWYKIKKRELDCVSPFEQIQMPIPIIGISFPCN